MLIRQSISDYKHLDFGNIKLAFTQVCKDELFKDVYFAAHALYYVEEGEALIQTKKEKIHIKKGEVAFIRQHSKFNIRKFKGRNGSDFKSIIFYLFPDFITEFKRNTRSVRKTSTPLAYEFINLGKDLQLKKFCESLKPLFEKGSAEKPNIRQKTFESLHQLYKRSKTLPAFLWENSKPIKIDLYEFMIHIHLNNYSVKELAALTGRSLSAFKRDFYEVFETTPHQWLLQKKIDYAEQLLTTEKMKASEIYFMLGFKELSHFSSAFKRNKGFSPTLLA